MRTWGLAVAICAVVLGLAAPASGAVWLAKTKARRVAVAVTAQMCRRVPWCAGSEVAPAERCRRERTQVVYCPIVFRTAARDRCRGVVGVALAPSGRIDHVMAVPMNCARAGAPPPTPT
jgi:hypothetical protein